MMHQPTPTTRRLLLGMVPLLLLADVLVGDWTAAAIIRMLETRKKIVPNIPDKRRVDNWMSWQEPRVPSNRWDMFDSNLAEVVPS